MISRVRFFLVDVFADEPLAGNPLAVVVDSETLDDAILKKIASELNQVETTFVLPATRPGADWRLRSFTAVGVEVFGAGHNALGAWWWLAESGALTLTGANTQFAQEIGDRVLPVEVIADRGRPVRIGMTQDSPSFGAMVKDRSTLAAALRLSPSDLRVDRLPAQVVSTGAAHLLVPVASRAAVDRARPNTEALLELLSGAGGEGCYVFCLEPIAADAVAHARFFNPTAGIVEDPATGTAAGPLGALLVAHGVAAEGPLVVEQGHAMKRPSRLQIQVRGSEVRIFGSATTAAEGTLRVTPG